MVPFHFLRKGILVRGSWYPIVKMEWVNGETMDSYIKNNLRNSSALRDLAVRWLQMLSALQRASITHGDLQHGNILIINGEIKLIDYDGMYVPALAGRGSHEVGHRNYQHPRRTEHHFGANVDNFSA
jgi:serine/threonine protein kinase